MASIAPSTHPSIACGPPIALMIRGMVMNGPTPIMSIMFSAIAERRFSPRTRPGLFSWLMSSAQQVHIQAHRARHAVRKLPEEGITGIDIGAFPESRSQHAAFERLLTRIIGR